MICRFLRWLGYAFILPLSGHSRLSYHRSTCFAVYEHPIIVSKESQRNAGNLAVFGIKNARRSAGQDELVFGGGVNQLLPLGSTVGLLDNDVAQGDHAVELAGSGRRLIIMGLSGTLA